jgi:hypothetical protein
MLSLSRLVFFNVACIRYLAFRSLGHRSPLVLCITTLVVVAHRQFRFFAIHSRMFPNFDVQSELLVVTTDDVLFPLLRPGATDFHLGWFHLAAGCHSHWGHIPRYVHRRDVTWPLP